MNTTTMTEWTDRTFLARVSQDLLQRFGGDMTRVTVVFPNKRARLFLNEELLRQTASPMWAPAYATIGELFETIVGDEVMEPIPAICRLYHIYIKEMGGKSESLDMFWGWGELLIQDFEDIDKHLVNAKSLFANAAELGQMESNDFLTENQLETLKRFFSSFTSDKKTYIQERFSELWTIMPRLYNGIRECMPDGVMPYRGALERKAVEDKELLSGMDTGQTYCFVGFNMLSETEKKLMSYLQEKGCALFYWDYDVMYKENNAFEAGDFIRENLQRFPNALARHDIYDNLGKKTDVTFISTSTDSIATRYIPEWLGTNLTKTERETALVLCDEQQLQTVLHAIPDGDTDMAAAPNDINITMGYMLTGTPVFSLVMALIALQTEGWDEKRRRFRFPYLQRVNAHPYSTYLNEEQWNRKIDAEQASAVVEYLDESVVSLAERTQEEADFGDVLMLESIYLVHKSLRQFLDVTADAEYPLHLQPVTLRRLLRRVLGSRSIPFHGEPAQGLQVMGVLETRCLDFRNILMLNVGEGLLPKNGMDNSMIPFTLRVGFGLTTMRHRVAVFAYYFYRLIQRAEHVTCIYNENPSGNVRHEMSRFLRQLQAETDIPIRYFRLDASQESELLTLDDIPKNETIRKLLHERYNRNVNPEARPLSPSAINQYLDCRMKFYLTAVCGMRLQQDPDEGIDARMMGNIFHNAAERIYKDMLRHATDNVITRTLISAYVRNKGELLQPFIDEQFRNEAGIDEFRGENILKREVIERYLLNLLRWDADHAPITMVEMESDVAMPLDVQVGENIVSIRTGGRVDRMDILQERDGNTYFRILDYKTGSYKAEVNKFGNIFMQSHKHAGYYLQTFLYALAVKYVKKPRLPIKPVLFYAVHARKNDYDPTLCIGRENGRNDEDSSVPSGPVVDISCYESEFLEKLREVVADIFSPEVPFSKSPDPKACAYCDFRKLCNR